MIVWAYLTGSFDFFPEYFRLVLQLLMSCFFISEFKGYPTKGVEAKKTLWWYWRFGDSCSNSADGHWPVGALHTVQHSEEANDSEGVQAVGQQWQVCIWGVLLKETNSCSLILVSLNCAGQLVGFFFSLIQYIFSCLLSSRRVPWYESCLYFCHWKHLVLWQEESI